MAKALTVQSVERLKLDRNKRLEIPDGLLPGLYFVLQPSGVRSWAMRYRHTGKSRKLTLGPYPVLGLGAARARAREALQVLAFGRDPAAAKQDALRAVRLGDPNADRSRLSWKRSSNAMRGQRRDPERHRRRLEFSGFTSCRNGASAV